MPFKALSLHPQLVQATKEMGYTEPTPIQKEAIPHILAGRDLIATAHRLSPMNHFKPPCLILQRRQQRNMPSMKVSKGRAWLIDRP